MPDDSALQRLCQDISDPGCEDRAARLQVFCEHTWDRLNHLPLPAEHIVQGFMAVLQDDANLLLARLVIPDLRPDACAPSNPFKLKLWQQINPQRPSLEHLHKRPQTSDTEARRLYEEEKSILQEAELYRAAMLLYGHGPADETQKEGLLRWLATYPADSH